MSSYWPGTVAYKVRTGLDFAERMSEDRNEESRTAFRELEEKIQRCQKEACPYEARELRDLADRVAPGLGQVDVICDMVKAVK